MGLVKMKIYNKDIKQRHSKVTYQKSGLYEWETPQYFFDGLNKEFKFTLDVCAREKYKRRTR